MQTNAQTPFEHALRDNLPVVPGTGGCGSASGRAITPGLLLGHSPRHGPEHLAVGNLDVMANAQAQRAYSRTRRSRCVAESAIGGHDQRVVLGIARGKGSA